MIKKSAIGILLGALALSGASLSFGGGIYRWVDEQGVTHFGEKPPAPGVGEKIRVSTPTPSSTPAAKADATPPAAAPAAAAAPTAANDAEAAQAKARDEAIKKNCEAHAANLKVLRESARVREQGDDGQVRMLTDEEKQSRIEQAEKFLAEHCQAPKK